MQSRPGSGAGLRAGGPGTLVCVGPRVQRVEHGQLRVVDHPDGVINGVGCILLDPVRIVGRSLPATALESRCYQAWCRATGLALRVMSRRPCTVSLSMDTSPAGH
jgi:hypothetical protein